jgi:hypothetical protein
MQKENRQFEAIPNWLSSIRSTTWNRSKVTVIASAAAVTPFCAPPQIAIR